MAFPSSIAAAQFSSVCISTDATAVTNAIGTPTQVNLKACFDTTSDYIQIPDVRDMPAFGTPANIVKVPVYGQAQTQSIGAQSDAPDLELTVNYVPSKWAAGTALGGYEADGIAKVFQVALLPAQAADFATNTTTGGLRNVPNALIYFIGKIESVLVQPARDDAMTATVAMSIQSDFYGPFTVDAA